jgi:predicted DNA-binding transcriptional regulator AlpA
MLADNPSRAADLPPAVARALLARCAVVQSALLVPALAGDAPEAAREAEPGGDRLLTADEAAQRLGVTTQWLQRHPRLPFVRKLGHRTVRYSENGLRRWQTAQRP